MTHDQIPMFVKEHTLLPPTEPVEHITASTVFKITCNIYGNPMHAVQLFEDNGTNFNFEKGL